MTPRDNRGFTLIELMIVILVFGTIVGFSVPGLKIMMGTQNLKGAADNITGQLQLARQKAIATRTTQEIHFYLNTLGSDYHIHNAGGVESRWDLPNGITYWTAGDFEPEYIFSPDGSCDISGLVIVQNPKGKRDTVSVSASGMILHL